MNAITEYPFTNKIGYSTNNVQWSTKMTDMSLHPGQKNLIIFHTRIVLIVPTVSRDQGGNERGWRDQIC